MPCGSVQPACSRFTRRQPTRCRWQPSELRTGCQWKALDATGICSGSMAHRRYQQWVEAGVFARLWDEALRDYDDVMGLDLE